MTFVLKFFQIVIKKVNGSCKGELCIVKSTKKIIVTLKSNFYLTYLVGTFADLRRVNICACCILCNASQPAG
jgi:hypothetical protein